MTSRHVYYFDVLPLRPQPKPLESLTSYLTRLAAANKLRLMGYLFACCFPNDTYPSLKIFNRDFPSVSLGDLPRVAQCSEDRLLATTFVHLGQKFGRLPYTRAISSFLSGVLARQLRYCPLCLAERDYYLLTWRFLAVEGCVEHGCHLLDCCGHCGQPVPFLSYTPQLGVCPHCQGDLRTCSVTYLDEHQFETVQARTQDFEYLLTPQAYETQGISLLRSVGQRLAYWRQMRGLTIAEVARRLNQYPPVFSSMEHGNRTRGLGFQRYLAYVDLLQLRLRDIFEIPLEIPTSDPPPSRSYEEKALQKIQQAVTTLEQQGQSVTQAKVKQMTEVGRAAFTKYPKVRAFWAEYKAKSRQRWEEEMIQRVHQAAAILKQQGQEVTKTNLSQWVGQDPNNLRYYYPTVWAVVTSYSETMARPLSAKKQASTNQPRPYRREVELIHKVEQAIEQLQREGKLVSQYAIADLVGMSTDGLIYYPQVRAILRANKAEPQSHDEDALLARVQKAVADLEASEARISQAAVARQIGRAICTFYYYPQVKSFLREQVARYRQRRTRQRQQREAELVEQVYQAIELLATKNNRVTQKAIGEMIGVSVTHLYQYPQVRLLLQQANPRRKSTQSLPPQPS